MMIGMNLHSRRAHKTAGFTLVELAIVLVIVGLIIGGVLTAQQITQNARITNAVQAVKSLQAATQSYNQNYGALPGDDANAATRFPNKVLGSGDGKGTIESVGNQNEPVWFWSHLRAAGLIKGDGNSTTLPSNPFSGGFYTIHNGAFDTTNGFVAGTSVVCLDHVPGGAALAIDLQLDDGKATTGNMRSAAGGDTSADIAGKDSYDNNGIYVMCASLL
ncbi:MAG: type II secretion system protein [Alphaproteobacteria bacterium]